MAARDIPLERRSESWNDSLLRRRPAGALATLVALSCAAVACGSRVDEGPGAGGASGAGGGGGVASQGGSGATGAVTWSEHVAPIVYRECVGCHREGGIAPFALTTYFEVASEARRVAVATAERHMPPMPVDNGGSCNTYSNARWLSDAEIATLGAWYLEGAPEGDPALAPALPPPEPGLARADVTLDPGASYTPSTSLPDDYRCFVVDPGLASTQYLVGYDVVPGDPRIVHHAIVYLPEDDAGAAQAEALDAGEEGLGYTCFGGAGVDSSPLVLWAPGAGVVNLPESTGLPIPPARKLILQVHYNLGPGAFSDRTTVRLQTAPSVVRPGAFLPVADLDLEVPPGEEHAVSSRTFPIEPPIGAATVHGVLPHMHTLGRTLRLSGAMGLGSTCFVSVDRWDFHWQNAWWYQTPLAADGLRSITLSCGYDTRGRTTPVAWGEGTGDEMCLVYLYVTG